MTTLARKHLSLYTITALFLVMFYGIIVLYEEADERTGVSVREVTSDQINVVASIHGKTYHLPWCSGAFRIKEQNKIHFENERDAENAGYRLARNCKGSKL